MTINVYERDQPMDLGRKTALEACLSRALYLKQNPSGGQSETRRLMCILRRRLLVEQWVVLECQNSTRLRLSRDPKPHPKACMDCRAPRAPSAPTCSTITRAFLVLTPLLSWCSPHDPRSTDYLRRIYVHSCVDAPVMLCLLFLYIASPCGQPPIRNKT
jgi:hypothetical protein